MSEDLLICDLRREWRGKPYITFWRPNNAGYAFPLSWAGNYSPPQTVSQGGSYYTSKEGLSLIRFAVPRHVAERYSQAPAPGMIEVMRVQSSATLRPTVRPSERTPSSPPPKEPPHERPDQQRGRERRAQATRAHYGDFTANLQGRVQMLEQMAGGPSGTS